MNIKYDKALHFLVCFLIAILLYPLIGWWGAATGLVTGVFKELFDLDDYGVFSWGDMIADTLGVAFAIGVIVLIKSLI